MLSQFTRAVVCISVSCFAGLAFFPSVLRAAEPESALADYEADVSEYDVVGKVVREWNEGRERNEFVVHDRRDGTRYVILSSQVVERGDLVGHRVGLNGRTRRRADDTEALIHPDLVDFLDSDVELAQFVSEERSVAPRVARAPGELSDIDIFMPGSGPLVGDGDLYGGQGPVLQLGDNYRPGRFWVSAEYLRWRTTGMKLPPLVTGNPLGTPEAEAGVIGIPSTTILLGNGTILDEPQSGFRYSAGYWFCDGLALEAEVFHFLEHDVAYRFDSSLNQILGRPFMNRGPLVPPFRYDTQLIVFPPIIDGYVNVFASSQFHGAAARLKFNLKSDCQCQSGCQTPCVGACSSGCGPKPKWGKLNLTTGYRYLQLEEHLRIEERVITAGDQYDAIDDFRTRSRFHGLEVGFDGDFHCSVVDVNVFSRLSGGITRNRVQISGQTDETIGAVVTSGNSGILAQASNIGTRSHDSASLVAELGFDFQRQVTSCLRVNAGYSVLYWGKVARAGEQIDLSLHPGLFQPPVAVPGTIGALPTHRFSDFVAHGLNLGATLVF